MSKRQIAYQSRRMAKGLCATCGKRKLAPRSKRACAVCLEVQRRVQRARSGSKPWRKGNRGRPPSGSKG